MKMHSLAILVAWVTIAAAALLAAADSKPPTDPEYKAFAASITKAQKNQLSSINAEFDPRLEAISKEIKELESRKPKPSSLDPFGPNAKPLTREEEAAWKSEEAAWKSYEGAREKLRSEESDLETKIKLKKWAVFAAEQRAFLSVRALKSDTNIEFIDTPLKDVCNYLQDMHHLPIVIDDSAATIVADEEKAQITSNFRHLTLDTGLRLVLEQAGLVHILRDGSIVIASKEAARKYLAQGAIDTAPLIAPIKAARMKAIEEFLNQPVTYQCTSKDLYKVLNGLGGKDHDYFWMDEHSMSDANINAFEVKVTVDLKNMPLKDALTKILAPAGLTYRVRDEKIAIVPGRKSE